MVEVSGDKLLNSSLWAENVLALIPIPSQLIRHEVSVVSRTTSVRVLGQRSGCIPGSKIRMYSWVRDQGVFLVRL